MAFRVDHAGLSKGTYRPKQKIPAHLAFVAAIFSKVLFHYVEDIWAAADGAANIMKRPSSCSSPDDDVAIDHRSMPPPTLVVIFYSPTDYSTVPVLSRRGWAQKETHLSPS